MAVSAIAAPIVRGVSASVGNALSLDGQTANTFMGSMAGTIAAGAVRQLVYGGKADFASIAADAFGNALGNSFVDGQVAKSEMQQQAILDAAREEVEFIEDPRGINLGEAGPGFVSEGRSGPTGQMDRIHLAQAGVGPFMEVPSGLYPEELVPRIAPTQHNDMEDIGNLRGVAGVRLRETKLSLAKAELNHDYKEAQFLREQIRVLDQTINVLGPVKGMSLEQIEERGYRAVKLPSSTRLGEGSPLEIPGGDLIRLAEAETGLQRDYRVDDIAYATKVINGHSLIDEMATGRQGLETYERAHLAMDKIQDHELQFLHAIRSEVRGNQTSERFVRALANLFIRETMITAAQYYNAGDTEEGRFYEGMVRHTLQDSISQAHRDPNSDTLKLWRNEPGIGRWMGNQGSHGKHVADEFTFSAQPLTESVRATRWIANSLTQYGLIERGDIIRRYRVDAVPLVNRLPAPHYGP
jgi:hypothetical protein